MFLKYYFVYIRKIMIIIYKEKYFKIFKCKISNYILKICK